MKVYTVKELMVPLAEYATVSEEATLYEAITALEKAQNEFERSHYRHRAVLAYAPRTKKITGKLSQVDILRALEPQYEDLYNSEGASRYGLTKNFMSSMLVHYNLWSVSLEQLCRAAADRKVKSFIRGFKEGEMVDLHQNLDLAAHLLVMGGHQSLMVVDNDEVVGILRLTDVFAAVFHTMKSLKEIGRNSS